MKALQRGGTWYHSMQHLHHSATYSLQLALMKWEGRPEKVRPLVILSTFRCLLWLPPEGLASSGQKRFIKSKFSSKYLLMPVPYCTFDRGIWHSALCCAWNLRSAHMCLKFEICTVLKLKKKCTERSSFFKTLRHCNCSGSENFWSETNRHDYVIHR